MCRPFFCQMQLRICGALSTSRRDSFIIRPLIKNDFGNEVQPAANENYVSDLSPARRGHAVQIKTSVSSRK